MSVGPEIAALSGLTAGQAIPFGGDRVTMVGADLAAAYQPGDRLVVVQSSGALLHIPRGVHEVVAATVGRAQRAFADLASCSDEQISDFFARFAAALADDATFEPIAAANAADIEQASRRGRSTTRLRLDASMRAGMVDGLRGWQHSPSRRGGVVGRIEHARWSVTSERAPLGVVGFVFEGRPNVFADACGVVRTGNAVVFRIGSDALATARAIVEHALDPALRAAGLPAGLVGLVDSPTHAAGHALFADRRLALAVARGSGAAVAELGAVASQSGVPVSLHGTGGAWVVIGESASPEVVRAIVANSLDRKVCNTVNVCVVMRRQAAVHGPAVLAGLDAAGAARGAPALVHVVEGSDDAVPRTRFEHTVTVQRADGVRDEAAASVVELGELATEWEWEESPEITLVVVDDLDEAISLCNRYSPRFVASLLSEVAEEHERFYAAVDAPFVGDGFTRWVDGQYALNAPELGLSNWQNGRILGRGAILSGDSVHTIRYRATVHDPDLRR
jgi:glutamate-5-semialdehyde dehydrogenase